MDAIVAATRPGGRAINGFKRGVNQAVVADHKRKMLDGVDGRGRALAPLAASTLADPRRRAGGPLCSGGESARFITHFRATWVEAGGRSVLSCAFVQLLSKPTKKRGPEPFAQYHLTGATKPGSRWVLPRRNVAGITPRGWGEVHRLVAQFWLDLRAYGGGR
jgi:hypothetical protein